MIFRQRDYPGPLGRGPHALDMALKGCGHVSLAQLANDMDTSTLDPRALHEAAWFAWDGAGWPPFVRKPREDPPHPGGILVWGVVAAAAGLRCAEALNATEVPALRLRRAIHETLAAGGRAVLWVDHDEHKRGGDWDGDHYVSLRRVDGDVVVYADSATGLEGRLDLVTLRGPSVWSGEPRLYQLRGVRPVFAA